MFGAGRERKISGRELPNLSFKLRIRSSNTKNAAFTAGVISASSSGGILLMQVLSQKTTLRVQIDSQLFAGS